MRIFLLSLILLSFCCATSKSSESQSDTSRLRDTEVVKVAQTGPETITTTTDTYLPPTCEAGEVLWPDGTGGFYCGSAPQKDLDRVPQAVGNKEPERGAPQKHSKPTQDSQQHGPLLSHQVIVDQKGPVVTTTDAKGQTQTKTDTESKKASNWHFGPGALGWGLIAAAVLGALALALRFGGRLWG